MKKVNNSIKRILVGAAMILVAAVAAAAEYYGIPAVRHLVPAVVITMSIEWIWSVFNFSMKPFWKREKKPKTKLPAWRRWMGFIGIAYFVFVLHPAAESVGGRPWIVLLLLLIISAADTGAWLFGKIIGGDKMWPALSPGKTWSGQIAGILCGTAAAVIYGAVPTDRFLPQLMWIGMSVALMSQYGDLTASWLKRKLGIKDFSDALPGHGGLIDRFDGWIYVLPVVWLVML